MHSCLQVTNQFFAYNNLSDQILRLTYQIIQGVVEFKT